MAARALCCWISLGILIAGSEAARAQQVDTLSITTKASAHSPTGALWRSAVFPGLGQIYNHQAYKAPIVLAVLGGLTVLAVHNDNRFDRYHHAYLYGAYLDQDPHPFPQYQDEYMQFPGVPTSILRSRRDAFRRNRDLTIIGIVIAYGLNVLDAYVNGQLYGFDVGEDLSANDGIRTSPLTMTFRVRF